mgnify:CR=1 FL=1|tara:strand:- start:1023 stop:1970 length:948 start_codon:yes stop_codon:yes gene_type:complete
MFSFLRRKKNNIKLAEPMHFIGKYPVDPEYIKMGDNEAFIFEVNAYLKLLHGELISIKGEKLSDLAVCYFLEVDTALSDCVVGRVGPSQDKSERDNLFMLSRHVMDESIKKYPLFIPSLYNDFFRQTDELLNQTMTCHSLSDFQIKLNNLNQSSLYLDNKQVLNTAVDQLKRLSIEGYRQSLAEFGIVLSTPILVGIWRQWRNAFVQGGSLSEYLPVKIELPSDDNLNYYVSFICQVIEPLFEFIGHYRIFWWRDELHGKAWCLISNTKKDPQTDLLLFNHTLSDQLRCLRHEQDAIPLAEAADSLLDALQVVAK